MGEVGGYWWDEQGGWSGVIGVDIPCHGAARTPGGSLGIIDAGGIDVDAYKDWEGGDMDFF